MKKSGDFSYVLDEGRTESDIWYKDISPLFADMPENVRRIWHYGFTEMFNNVIDHSSASKARVEIRNYDETIAGKTENKSYIVIADDGEGVFKKIQRAFSLFDERHAALELAKGKTTTDITNHSGQGIFFTSWMFDYFRIRSGSIIFERGEEEEQISETEEMRRRGTRVFMILSSSSKRTTTEVFDRFSPPDDDCEFNKTTIPVRWAEYGDDTLISRSQAKRLLARLEKFKTVTLDFTGVETIGQAFADEVFRVFNNHHPETQITPINAAPSVLQMINRAQRGE